MVTLYSIVRLHENTVNVSTTYRVGQKVTLFWYLRFLFC